MRGMRPSRFPTQYAWAFNGLIMGFCTCILRDAQTLSLPSPTVFAAFPCLHNGADKLR